MTPQPRPSLARIGGPMSPIPGLGTPGTVRLCSNESPLGMSAAAIEAAAQALRRGHEYPEGEGQDLVAAIAAHFAVPPARIRLGPGSDTLIMQAVCAFAGAGDEVLFSARGYARYARNALIAGATPVPAPDDDFRADLGALLAAVTPRTRLVMLANPDNPSGAMLPMADIAAFHTRLPGHVLLVLDCAYAEYVRDPTYDDGGLALAGAAENVLVSRTFSKLYGMAGLRLGWITGAPSLLDAVGRVGPTFPVSLAALAAGRAALADRDHQAQARAHNDAYLPQLVAALSGNHARARPSQANFVLVDLPGPEDARGAVAHLARLGLLVRGFGPGAHQSQIRISIGPAEALHRTAAALNGTLKQGH